MARKLVAPGRWLSLFQWDAHDEVANLPPGVIGPMLNDEYADVTRVPQRARRGSPRNLRDASPVVSNVCYRAKQSEGICAASSADSITPRAGDSARRVATALRESARNVAMSRGPRRDSAAIAARCCPTFPPVSPLGRRPCSIRRHIWPSASWPNRRRWKPGGKPLANARPLPRYLLTSLARRHSSRIWIQRMRAG
ncbi:hypothetical protein CBM2606_A60147 [Cupriavidus taiwanensis]|nr:hypothetical protein CBM2606_A60147 [Cupriavidus taiwanensis]